LPRVESIVNSALVRNVGGASFGTWLISSFAHPAYTITTKSGRQLTRSTGSPHPVDLDHLRASLAPHARAGGESITPILFGSTPHSLARLRTIRTARCVSANLDGRVVRSNAIPQYERRHTEVIEPRRHVRPLGADDHRFIAASWYEYHRGAVALLRWRQVQLDRRIVMLATFWIRSGFPGVGPSVSGRHRLSPPIVGRPKRTTTAPVKRRRIR